MIPNEVRISLQKTCSALNSLKVDFVLIGGVAVGFYGYESVSGGLPPEMTHDIDFWYNPTIENFQKIINALDQLTVDVSTLKELIFDPKKPYLRIPYDGFKIEFLPQMSGLDSFAECRKRAKTIKLDGNELLIISYNDLIGNKKAVI